MIEARAIGVGAALTVASLLTGCGGGEGVAHDRRAIVCGPEGVAPTLQCTVEVVDSAGNLLLTVRRPDGGFRRLSWPRGKALTAADGAEPLRAQSLPGGGVGVSIGGWTYRIERQGGGLP